MSVILLRSFCNYTELHYRAGLLCQVYLGVTSVNASLVFICFLILLWK